MTESLTLALITDIHIGEDTGTKAGSRALEFVGDFVAAVNGLPVDLVLDLGDRLLDVEHEVDRKNLAALAGAFAPLRAPRVHLLGNHDVINLSAAEHEALLGGSFAHRSVDLKGWHLVFWQPDVIMRKPEGFAALDADLAWLQADLAASKLPTVVFSHVPLAPGSMTGNYYFQRAAHYGHYPNWLEIQQVLRENGQVVLCMAGHVHWNSLNTSDGVHFLTQQSLVESFTTTPHPAQAWGTLELGAQACWQVHGRDPVRMVLPLKQPGRGWLPPKKPETPARVSPGEGLGGVRGLLLDLDGVLYRGDDVIAEAPAFVRYLRSSGRRCVALTNNARFSPEEIQAKLAAMDIAFEQDQIIHSGQATAWHLAKLAEHPAVFVAASAQVRAELLRHGALESAAPAFVVAGYDPDLSLARLDEALGHLRNGARLIATNPDPVVPTPNGAKPESGAVIAYLEAASGKKATVIGKPNRVIYQLALERLGLKAPEVLAVGDTMETDIAGALGMGMRAVYVATGNPYQEIPGSRPTLRINTLTELQAALAAARE